MLEYHSSIHILQDLTGSREHGLQAQLKTAFLVPPPPPAIDA